MSFGGSVGQPFFFLVGKWDFGKNYPTLMNLVFPDFGLQSSAFGLLLLVLRILFDRITGEFLDFAVYEDCNFSFFFYPVRGTNFTFVRKLTGRCCQSLKIMIDLLMVLVEVSLDHLQSVQLLFFNLVIVHSLFKLSV